MLIKCGSCGRRIDKGDDYIKYDDRRYCSKCYDSYQVVTYTVNGDYLATDGDGVEEHGNWNEEELV